MKKTLALILSLVMMLSVAGEIPEYALAAAKSLENVKVGTDDDAHNTEDNNKAEPTDENNTEQALLTTAVKQPKSRATGRGKIRVKCNKVKVDSKDVAGYVVLKSRKRRGGFKIIKTTKNRAVSLTDSNVRINKTYYYKVRTYKIVKGKKVYGNTSNTTKVKNKLRYKATFRVKAYAYTGHYMTASGKRARVGRVAVDPRVIPLGTWLYVQGYGICQACDTGGAIKGRTVDLFMNSESQCNRWGVRYPKVYILK